MKGNPMTEEQIEHMDEYVTDKTLFERTKISVAQWQRWRGAHKGPKYSRLGKKLIRYRWGDVVEWLDEHRKERPTNDEDHTAPVGYEQWTKDGDPRGLVPLLRTILETALDYDSSETDPEIAECVYSTLNDAYNLGYEAFRRDLIDGIDE